MRDLWDSVVIILAAIAAATFGLLVLYAGYRLLDAVLDKLVLWYQRRTFEGWKKK